MALKCVELKKVSLMAVIAGSVACGAWGQTQDQSQPQSQPSVADAARAARQNKEKSATQPKKVLTDDDMPSTGGSSAGPNALGLSSISAPNFNSSKPGVSSSAAGLPDVSGLGGGSAGSGDPMDQAWAGINRAEASLDRLAPLDRASLAKVVLEHNDVNFPGRSAWEDRLFAAKERYVAHSRQLLSQMTGIMQGAQSLTQAGGDGKVDTAQAQQLMSRAQQLLADAQSTEAAFKSVMEEGQKLAQSAH